MNTENNLCFLLGPRTSKENIVFGVVVFSRYVKGCLQSCDDADGCNDASHPSDSRIPIMVMISLIGSLRRIVLF